MTTADVTPDDPKTPFHDARSTKTKRFAKNPATSTLYAAVDYKDAEGTHAAGTAITLPSDTPEQQAEIDTMIRYGVLTKTKPKA